MGVTRFFILPSIFTLAVAAILVQWNLAVGFDAFDARWWQWMVATMMQTGSLPDALLRPVYWTGGVMALAMIAAALLVARAGASTVIGGRRAAELHGSARWAKAKDLVRAKLLSKTGVVVGGWRRWWGTRVLRHDGPEHVLMFAPTRSGKGVGVILPTLLSWTHSVLVLDIKGENFALTAGWRASQGHRILRFEPAAESGSVRFNPLAEVRINTGNDIADCQNIASMIIDPDGKGLKDYWMQEGWSWLSVLLLHVVYRIHRDDGRAASLRDVNQFLSAVADDDTPEADASFQALLDDMIAFDHGAAHVNAEVGRGARAMKIKAPQERSGVHSSAGTQLRLYADPNIARNIETSDFRLSDLMHGDAPAALYLIVAPTDIQRLRPLIRLVLALFLGRMTSKMDFADGRSVAGYKHRLLLMLDEFTSVGKLEIFENSLAYIAGYGLKAFIVVQDLAQLQKAYGREESIMSNCHLRLAYAPNKIETAKVLSDMTGQTTIVQRKRTSSGKVGEIGSVSDAMQETSRPLLTADEIMRLRLIQERKRLFGLLRPKIIPGDMLIFSAGSPPILGRQILYFKNRILRRRAAIPAPVSPENTTITQPTGENIHG